MTVKKNAVILLGPPTAGKGTLAFLLKKALGYYHFSSSSVIMDFINRNPEDEDCIKQKRVLEQGGVCSAELVLEALPAEMERVLKNESFGVIIDGPPRRVKESDIVFNTAAGVVGEDNVYVVDITASEDVLVLRASQRRVCSRNRKHVFSTKDGFDVGHVCPYCDGLGGKLIVREEDLEVRERLEKYKAIVRPAHERVIDLKGGFISINTTNSSAEEGFKVILRALNLP